MIKNSKKRFSNRLFSAAGLVIIVSILALSSSISAQMSGRPDRGFQAGNSYAISDIEAVNMTGGGNVSMSIPLASLPKGRGTSPGFTLSLTYDSKLWNSEQKWESDAQQQTGSNPISYDYVRNVLEPAEDGGWNVFASYRMRVINRNERGNFEKCVPYNDDYSKNGYAFKIEMLMPGGGIKSFHPYGDGVDFVDFHKDGFHRVDPNGKAHRFSLITHVNDPNIGTHATCQYTAPQITTTGMNYYSTDGSNIRLFIPYVAGASATGGDRRWIMSYADGTVVENNPSDDATIYQRITDTNGNRVKFKGDTHNGVPGIKITDDVGRFIFYGGNKIIQKSVNGEELETTLTWKNTWVYRNYRTVAWDFLISIPEYKRNADIYQQFTMLDEITLPTQAGGLTYKFTYHADDTDPDPYTGTQSYNYTDGWGELASVILPSGARAEYKYYLPEITDRITFKEIISNKLTRKDLIYDETYDGQTTQKTDTWLYNINNYSNNNTFSSNVSAPDGNYTSQSYYGKNPFLEDAADDWRNGLVHSVTNPDGSVTTRVWKQQGNPTLTQIPTINPYIASETTTIRDAAGNPSLSTKREYDYDQNMNLLQTREYDWSAAGASSFTLKRKTVNTYYNQTQPMSSTTTDGNYYANPNSPALLNLIKSTEVQNAAGTPVSRAEFVYDNSPATPIKGNLTKVITWDSTKGGFSFPLSTSNSISATTQYDQYGNPALMTDAKGIQTQITYGYTGSYAGLYPTETKTALGLPEQRTSTATYDFNTGLTMSATDVDNNVTSETEYDALGRPLKVKAAVGTANEIWIRTEYNDVERRVISRSDLAVKGDGKKVGIQHFDELGRVRLARVIEDIQTEDPYNEADGIKVQTRYRNNDELDLAASNGSYSLTSNPYRAATAAQAGNEETMGWSVGYVKNGGKYSTGESFAGATLPAPWGSNANSTGMVRTEIDVNRTLVTDQAGKQRISLTNALGQLTDVWEVKASDSSTESISFPTDSSITHAYKTSYAYDTLNNLTTVNQGQQTRTFTYSSLSRLLSANNPESGLISYVYDNGGNLTSKTDARQITTSYVYDNINRVKTRSYAGEPTGQTTPTVTYTYDNKPNAIGLLTKVTNGLSTTEYQVFDRVGRVTQSQQSTDGTAYNPMTYAYNLSGAMIEQTYPSGRKVKNVLDNDGQLAMVQSKKNAAAGYFNYANSFTYNAAGATELMQLGNGKWESTIFNSRLQPTQIALGTVQNGTDKLKLNYTYGGTNNNGNVLTQTIKVPDTASATGFEAIQTYNYDELNRLKSAEEKIANATSWKQTYTFDRYGNRRFDEANTDTLASTCTTAVCNPTIDPATNKLIGYTFDTAGNTKVDANGQTFTYDAENKQILVKDSSNNTVGEYFYDGDGKRVKKKVGNEETIFVYNASGQLVAEYTNQTPQNAPKVSYLTTDHLGSPRITTDVDGKVYTRRDFMPFGEEIDVEDTSQRSAGLNYASDEIRQKFTSYERDNETELDFAQARMYANKLGRFTSPDPLLSSGRIEETQSWNRYAYVSNNPLLYIDPTGLYECNADADQCSAFAGALAQGYEALKKYKKKSKKYKRLERALDTYGCDASVCGEKGKNGITVGVDKKYAGATYVEGVKGDVTDANPTGRSIQVLIGADYLSSDNEKLAGMVAHEGAHAADGTDWIKSDFSKWKNPSSYKIERDAFLVTSYVVQQVNESDAWVYTFNDGKKNEVDYSLYSKSWKKVDKERLKNIKGIIKEAYQVTKKERGEKTFGKGVTFKDYGL